MSKFKGPGAAIPRDFRCDDDLIPQRAFCLLGGNEEH